jgi:hypothetical protein
MPKPRKTSPVNPVDNIIGWAGVIFVLAAYSLVSFDVVSAQTITFQGLMLLGSFGIMLVAYRRHDMQPVILNLIFALIALVSLVRIVFYL